MLLYLRRRRVAGSACVQQASRLRAAGAGAGHGGGEPPPRLPADAREYGIGSQILADLGLTTIRVLTNNPKKITGISGFGLSVVSQEPIEIVNPENLEYLESEERAKMGHRIGRTQHQGVRFDPETA